MRRDNTRWWGISIAVLLLATTATGCQSSTPPDRTGTGADVAAQKTYVPQYGTSVHAYRPHRLNASVDGSLYITGMQWAVWSDSAAVGHGTAHVNDCRPDCADGHYTAHPVTVRLGKPQDLCGSRFFTALRVRGSDYQTSAHWAGVGCLELATRGSHR
jgi:hypothetical protein